MKQNDRKVIETEQDILEGLYNKLIQSGAAGSSIRELCKNTGYSMGSLYYWFDNKDDLIVRTAQYGMSKIVGEITEAIETPADSVEQIFLRWMDKVPQYINCFCFVHQVAADPNYRDRMSSELEEVIVTFEKCTGDIAERFSLDVNALRGCVMLFYSAVLTYSIWGSEERYNCKMKFVLKSLECLKTVKE